MTAVRERTVTRLPGEPGIWLFVLGDMIVFAICFGVLAVTYARDPGTYQASQAQLHVVLGALNTVVLLTSSLAMALAVRAARGGNHTRSTRLVSATMACAAAFVMVKASEYVALVSHGATPRTNDFYLYYFCFTGLHLFHVAIGCAVLGCIRRIVRRPCPTPHELTLVECGASYWHMVDLLWIVLFALLYLVRAS